MTREEAIRRIKAWNLDADDMEVLSEVIPELKESEDEKIRKVLVSIVKWLGFDSSFFTDNSVTKSEVLAYLEKQKEQKPTEWCEEIIRKGIKEVGLTQYQINWLKSNVFPPKEEQKPAEWSEEDELTIADLINYFEGDALECSTEEMVQRIKSLRPQPHLKPNEKQIEYLLKAIVTLARRLSKYFKEYKYGNAKEDTDINGTEG